MGTQANVLTPQQMRCIYALARGGGISNDDLHAVSSRRRARTA